MAHTPGPWTIEEYGDDDSPALVIHKDSESRVCFMATPGSHGDPSAIEADARLIAAAPDLLAALRAMTDRWEPDCSGQDRVMWENACSAIAKAEGR